MFDSLIGSQLVKIDDYGFTVKALNGDYRHFEFETDGGDCCGYAEIDTALFYDLNDPANNPIITNIQSEDTDNGYYRAECKITFFGGEKRLAEIEAEAGSGSGWCYGACATCKCVETKEEEVLASW